MLYEEWLNWGLMSIVRIAHFLLLCDRMVISMTFIYFFICTSCCCVCLWPVCVGIIVVVTSGKLHHHYLFFPSFIYKIKSNLLNPVIFTPPPFFQLFCLSLWHLLRFIPFLLNGLQKYTVYVPTRSRHWFYCWIT